VFGGLFYGLDEWLIFVILLGSLFLATEIGFQLGGRVRTGINEHARSQITTIQAAALGLLALLLGFALSMSISRFDARRQLVLDESNAIGTTLLRAQLLPELQRAEVFNRLRRYVDLQLESYQPSIDQVMLRQLSDKMEQLQSELWARGVVAGEKDFRAAIGLFLQSLNEMIDLHAKRMAALENHVPESIFIFLAVIAILSMVLVGYGCGIGARRNLLMTMTVGFLIALVILLVVDLDRPHRGRLKVSQQSMLELQKSLKKSGP
jgi:hypothetical protein